MATLRSSALSVIKQTGFVQTLRRRRRLFQKVTIGRRAMGALSARYETQYRVGNSIEIHDGATGNIVDWAKYRFNPPVAATYFLRDTGASGYIININQIQPSCEETFDSILAIIREARSLNVL